MNVTVYGETYSVYVRYVRLTLAEKGVPYELVPVDIFAEGGPSPEYLKRHPLGKIPAFDHDGFELYETLAITRYVDEAFDGLRLIPEDIKQRARMNQITALVDSYVYRSMIWGVFTGAISEPDEGLPRNEEQIAAGLKNSRACLDALQALRGDSNWLAGDDLSLADLSLASMLAYFLAVPEAQALWRSYPSLHPWWERLRDRPSMTGTRWDKMVA